MGLTGKWYCRSFYVSKVKREREGKFHAVIQMMLLHLRKHSELLIICELFSFIFLPPPCPPPPSQNLPYRLISNVNEHVARQGAN